MAVLTRKYIKDNKGKFAGSLPGLGSLPEPIDQLPAKNINNSQLNYDQLDGDLLTARWDLTTAHEGLSEPAVYSSEQERKRDLMLSAGAIGTMNIVYLGAIAYSISTGGALYGGITIGLLTPFFIGLCGICAQFYVKSKSGRVIST